jgi:hypothetical protein
VFIFLARPLISTEERNLVPGGYISIVNGLEERSMNVTSGIEKD